MMLTPEQEKLFEENKKLVYKTISLYIKNPGMYGLNTYEDIVSIGEFALCKAIASYDTSKGALSTYAMNIIRNHLYNVLRDSNDVLDKAVSESDEFIKLNADLAYNKNNNMTDDLILKEGMNIIDECGKKYGGIAEKGAEAIRLMILGYNCQDIATMYNVEPKLLTSWMSRARQKLKMEPALLKLVDKM